MIEVAPWPSGARPDPLFNKLHINPISPPSGRPLFEVLGEQRHPTGSQEDIAKVCDEVKELLLQKNRKYGDAALNPSRIFSKSDALEQIRVRMDDKLNRIKNRQDDEDEDVIFDLLGYLVLYRVAVMQKERRDADLQSTNVPT